jgi:hypothetical protein
VKEFRRVPTVNEPSSKQPRLAKNNARSSLYDSDDDQPPRSSAATSAAGLIRAPLPNLGNRDYAEAAVDDWLLKEHPVNMAPTEYWVLSSSQKKHPELARVARSVYGTPSSDVACESDFSVLGYVLNPRRKSLGEATVERKVLPAGIPCFARSPLALGFLLHLQWRQSQAPMRAVCACPALRYLAVTAVVGREPLARFLRCRWRCS